MSLLANIYFIGGKYDLIFYDVNRVVILEALLAV